MPCDLASSTVLGTRRLIKEADELAVLGALFWVKLPDIVTGLCRCA